MFIKADEGRAGEKTGKLGPAGVAGSFEMWYGCFGKHSDWSAP